MNEGVHYALAEVAVALAGFSGLVVVFRLQGAQRWSPTELRFLWLLIGDSLLVVLFALLPIPLALAGWSEESVWRTCCGLLSIWFFVADAVALRGELGDRAAGRSVHLPFLTPILRASLVVGLAMGLALAGSALGLIPATQALYVFGLLMLLGYAAIEFLFFIGLLSQQTVDD